MGKLSDGQMPGNADQKLDAAALVRGPRRKFPEGRAGASLSQRPATPERRRVQHKPQVVRAPGWERYRWLWHGFSSRPGGVSDIYGPGSLNLGWTSHDDARNVAENRVRFVKAVAGPGVQMVTLRQTHTGIVRIVEAGDSPLQTPEGKAVLRGDAVMTDVPGLLLGVQVADCVPVLVADPKRKAVAVFHAGWRGTLKQIVERGVGRMQLRYGSRPEDLIAVIGPSIGSCCYSVGEEVMHAFQSQFTYWDELFGEVYDTDRVREKYPMLFLTARAPGHSNIGPQIHLDLWEANRRQLLDAGLTKKKIAVIGECTACTRVNGTLKYFSHRGENGFAGRMIAAIGITGQGASVQ
jgi:polyphenol oxidase